MWSIQGEEVPHIDLGTDKYDILLGPDGGNSFWKVVRYDTI